MIDKIGNIGKIYQTGNNKGAKPAHNAGIGDDSISISKEAVKAQEVAKATIVVKQASDIRLDRVKEVREKLARGEYDNIGKEMLNQVANKIAQSIVGS